MARHNAVRWLLRPAPVMLLRRLFQDPIEARFRRHILAPVSQRRHDLAGRHAGKFFTVGNGQNLCALVLTQLVCRFGPHICRAAVGGNSIIAIAHPTLKCTQAQIKLGTCLVQAAMRGCTRGPWPDASWRRERRQKTGPGKLRTHLWRRLRATPFRKLIKSEFPLLRLIVQEVDHAKRPGEIQAQRAADYLSIRRRYRHRLAISCRRRQSRLMR